MSDEYMAGIRTIVEELVARLGFQATVAVTADHHLETSYLCSITVAEGQNFLIGQYGMNLAALQHLVRIMARKRIGEKLDIVVDVNDYFLEKKQILEKEAKQALAEVMQNNASVTLRPMLPYERKIIHSFLATHESVQTESVGIGEDRKVIVRPRTLAA